MRAIRYYGPGDVRLDEIPEPQVGAQQVKIKVACLLPVSPTLTQPNVVTNETLPVVMGHEMSGTVVAVGSGVNTSRLRIGLNVVVNAEDLHYVGPEVYLHDMMQGIGGCGGGLAEYISVDEDLVHALPDGVPLEVGALMEPLAVVWHAVKQSNIKAGDKVLVLGAGPIGLLASRVVRVFGASWVAVSEPALKRRQLAIMHGADAVYDPTSPGADIPALVRQATGNRGANVVLDCAGNQRTLDTALHAVRPRGSVVNVAVWEKKPVLDIDAITYKEVRFTGVIAYDRVHEEMLKAVAAGKFGGLENLITRRITLEDFVEKGLKALISEKDEHGERIALGLM
uniref:F-box and WD domain protein n=1 Tax=Ganoderma boninense TaxID=34458 RepID=A0A5K1K1E7_9APHY|nr:F-box and WD domain protein [Ganoderma boninense]